MRTLVLLALAVMSFAVAVSGGEGDKSLKLLFLGDKGHHRPADRFKQLAPVLKKRGIEMTYTETLTDLNAKKLADYDGLVVFANHTEISAEQEKAMLDFVASGKGLIPLHCASYCFLNSPKYIDIVGAQFRSHGFTKFSTTVAKVDHPILKGYKPFESEDETYVHTKHNDKDRIVLEYRVDGDIKEPWTWVRTHGKGRVFYTAWGHDQRTWRNAGFQNLVERGIRWACNDDPAKAGEVKVLETFSIPKMTKLSKDAPNFEYVEAKIPFYPPKGRGSKAISKMQMPVSPEDSMKHMIVPEGFEVKLFASEKQLGGKPLCMNWDERGRLWVVVTMDYPNELQPEGQGRDKIVILEDTDNDGVADKVTTFAEKLSIPTSIAFYKGGVIVHQAPHTLFMTEKDGKEASRKVLFTGWSTGDTHAGPSNLWYGHDNWMHGIVGYAGYFGRVGKDRHTFRQGFYRFRPDGSEMEFLRSTNNNSWGVGFSEEGLHFGSTANGNPSVYLPIPNRYYESVRGWSSTVLPGIAGNAPMTTITDSVRQVDWHGHFTAAAGHSLYTARTYPREYWNRTAFVCEPTGHVAATFTLSRDGANFRSRPEWNLLASDDEWCAPIQAEVGPDGHMWVIDWYNFIVQHNPTPVGFKTGKGNAYETELRDKKHGRIYRIVYKAAPKYTPITLSKSDTKTLLATLAYDNMRWRLHAQRLLVERGEKDVVPELVKLIENTKFDEIGLNAGAIHALWTLHGLGAADHKAVAGALKHPSAGVRRNAALVLPAKTASELIVTTGLLKDSDAQVRLAALLAIATSTGNESVGAALAGLLDDKQLLDDAVLNDGLTAATAMHAKTFLTHLAVRKADLTPKGAAIVRIVARNAARDPDSLVAVLSSLPRLRTAVAEQVLAGLGNDIAKSNIKLSAESEMALVGMLPKLSASGKATLLRVMGAAGSEAVKKHIGVAIQNLLATAEKEDTSDSDRAEAARAAVELRPEDGDIAKKLLDLISIQTPPVVVAGILEAVGASSAKEAAPELLARMSKWTPSAKAGAIRALLSRSTSTKLLLEAIDKGTVRLGDLTLEQKQALAAHPDKALAAQAKKLLEKGGALANPDRQKVVEQFMPLTKKTGDVEKGKALFKTHCAKCHRHSGEGENIGPDLTGMATHPKEEMLINIMDPSRSVEGNFRVYNITTTQGKVYQGMLASETKTSIELVDPEAKRFVIDRAKIDEFRDTGKSLMPEGFEKQVKEAELVDLLEFLAHKGKYVPLSLDKVATVVSTRGMFFSEDSTVERLIFSDWKPKTFNDVPFVLVDPKGDKVKNAVLLYGPQGQTPPRMPKSVELPVNSAVKSVHILGGVAGWASPYGKKGSVSMIVRLHYKDGKTEDHQLRNGEHIADYIRKVDVPESKFAYALRGQQLRYLAVDAKRNEVVTKVELVKGTDDTAPIVMALTVETR